MPEVKIIKQDIIVLHTENISEDDSYFHFADMSGATHRIKKNRVTAIELIKNNLGKAVQLNYGNYKGSKFIHTVDLAEGKLPPAEEPKLTQEQETLVKDLVKPQPSGQEIGLWWKIVAELIVAGKLSEVLGKENASNAVKAFRGQLVSVLKIPFDGAKFPRYKPEEKSPIGVPPEDITY